MSKKIISSFLYKYVKIKLLKYFGRIYEKKFYFNHIIIFTN